MRIIGFVASPQKHGNTAWVVEKLLEKAKEKNASTKIYYSSELDIEPCRGCWTCRKTNQCIINDDMQNLYKELEHSDVLVLGSPIYIGQMTAQAKTFVDRLHARFNPKFSPQYIERAKKKKIILVFTQGNPDQSLFQAYYDYTKKMFEILEFDVIDTIVVSNMRNQRASDKKELYDVIENIDF